MVEKTKLELLAEMRGITVEELRKQFSEMGKKSPRTGGFDKNPERASEAGRIGGKKSRKPKEA